MRVLLTNDDGIDCEGLTALSAALEAQGDYEVYTLAPDGNRSGVSHSITLRGPIRVVKRNERTWSCSGTPADCAIVAVLGGLPFKPDLVVSGINVGPNIGTDLVYSGTAAAARQAALHGIPAIALSLASFEAPFYWENAARFAATHMKDFEAMWVEDVFINVNIPKADVEPRGLLRTFPSRRRYNDSLAVYKAPDGHEYCFIEGGGIETEPEEGSDWDVVLRGYASASPVFIHPVVRRDVGIDVPPHAAASARPLYGV
ncbi:5'/3'-nucleotidase SurE [Treponema sp.]